MKMMIVMMMLMTLLLHKNFHAYLPFQIIMMMFSLLKSMFLNKLVRLCQLK